MIDEKRYFKDTLELISYQREIIEQNQQNIEEYKELVEHLQNATSILRENLLDLKLKFKFIWLTAFSSFAIAGLVAYLLSKGA